MKVFYELLPLKKNGKKKIQRVYGIFNGKEQPFFFLNFRFFKILSVVGSHRVIYPFLYL